MYAPIYLYHIQVQFFDVFEIDMNSFATVLEYCRGTDLDERYAYGACSSDVV